jgi:hypothetical protein
MGLAATREVTVRSVNGSAFTITDTDKIETTTTYRVLCDGPRCASRRGQDTPVEVSWVEEEVQKDPLAMPDAFYRLIKMTVDPQKPREISFCGPQCAKDFFTYAYTEATPPRIALENTKREQAKELAEMNPKVAKAILDAAPTIRMAFDKPSMQDKLAEEGYKPDRVKFETDVERAEEVVRKKDGLPSPEDLDVVAGEQEIAAITASAQADGDPGDEHA